MEQADTTRGADSVSERDRQGSKRTDRADDAEADEISGSDRRTEIDRPNEMGGLDDVL